MNQQASPTSGANGHSSAQDIFMLTDEQILEIDPDPQEVQVRAAEPEAKSAPASDSEQRTTVEAPATTTTEQAAPPAVSAPFSAPADLRALAELYPGGITQAKTAAERARTLDAIDAAYFGTAGISPEQINAARAQLAEHMLQENPAAFREMVLAGLRALEATEQPGKVRSVASALATLESPTAHANETQPRGTSAVPTAQASHRTQQSDDSAQQAHLAAYAAFEKAANEDLERRVGDAIEHTLDQAIPATGKPDGAALKGRMAAAIRMDIEKALQGDLQLGEQIMQILSAKRFDPETRAQVVRLIGERAQQLVPGAAKRALNDWTQATLAAHRNKSSRTEASSARREVAPAAPGPRIATDHTAQRKDAARSARLDGEDSAKNRINYGKLSDEQILDL